jgi:hypothetical protein
VMLMFCIQNNVTTLRMVVIAKFIYKPSTN